MTLGRLIATHRLAALRPADSLTVTFGCDSPPISLCFPGGKRSLGIESSS